MIEWLTQWFNVPFTLAFLISALLILVKIVLGGVGGADHDVDFEVDLDVDADMGGDIDAGADAAAGPSVVAGALMWLGMGKVPVMLVLEAFAFSFASIGWLVNAVWFDVIGDSQQAVGFGMALAAACVGGVFATKGLVSVLAHLFPVDGTISREAGEWVGEPAMVISTVTKHSGQVRVEGGGVIPDAVLSVKRDESCEADLVRGTKVVVFEYVATTNSYTVIPMEEMSQ